MRLTAAFVAVVRRLLHRGHMSVRDLASRVQMPERTVYEVMNGDQKVSLDQADDIADGLDVPLPTMVAASEDLADGGADTPTPDLRPGPLSLRVADIIGERMHSLGVDEAALAERSGLSQPALSQMLSGRRAIYLDELHELARALRLDPVAVLSEASDGHGA